MLNLAVSTVKQKLLVHSTISEHIRARFQSGCPNRRIPQSILRSSAQEETAAIRTRAQSAAGVMQASQDRRLRSWCGRAQDTAPGWSAEPLQRETLELSDSAGSSPGFTRMRMKWITASRPSVLRLRPWLSRRYLQRRRYIVDCSVYGRRQVGRVSSNARSELES